MDALPLETAGRLCQEIRDNQRIKVFTQCWGCVKFSKGETSKMCGEVVACNLVLGRFKKLNEAGKLE